MSLTAKAIDRRKPEIVEFLKARGAECMPPTNEWEMLRFRAGGDTGIVYRNKQGQLTLVGPAKKALDAFFGGHSWSAGVKTPRRNVTAKVQALLERDGDCCFLCGKRLIDDITVEHLVPIASGGPNHIANMALAHSKCNAQMGHLSVMEKVELRERYQFRSNA